MRVRSIRKKRVVWLVIRADDPTRGEWFLRERDASLKATWLRQSWKATVTLVQATIPNPEGEGDDE